MLVSNEEESDSKNHSFLRFVIVSTLQVLAMTICILSPCVLLVLLIKIGLQGEPFNYLAFIAFWSLFLIVIVFAAVVDWIKKRKHTE